MLNHIIAFCLKNRLVVLAVTVVLVIYGGRQAAKLPIDVFPNLNRPTVTIMTEAHGLAPEEVEVLLNQIDEKKEKVKPKITFDLGETVKIVDGPFMNFNGVVEDVEPERGKLKVSVAIFGRVAPVELEYWQVEKE